jgi:hypothetical protein
MPVTSLLRHLAIKGGYILIEPVKKGKVTGNDQ